MQTSIIRRSSAQSLAILLLSTFLIVNFLFFIDEGYYDLRWMQSGGNWITFVIYFGVLFGAQLFCHRVILKKYHKSGKTSLAIFGGSLLLLLIVYGYALLIRGSL